MPAPTATHKIVAYFAARTAGMTQAAAARHAGISVRTAARADTGKEKNLMSKSTAGKTETDPIRGPGSNRGRRIAANQATNPREANSNNYSSRDLHRRRNRTVDGDVVVEELRPGSKAWVEVDPTRGES